MQFYGMASNSENLIDQLSQYLLQMIYEATTGLD